ncbi:hypothetical protein WA158_004147 [Blastocystis sp. Blastoise]
MDSIPDEKLISIKPYIENFQNSIRDISVSLISTWNLGMNHASTSYQLLNQSINNLLSSNTQNPCLPLAKIEELKVEEKPLADYVFLFEKSNKKYTIERSLISKFPGSLFEQLVQEEKNTNNSNEYSIDHNDLYIPVIIKYMDTDTIDLTLFSDLEIKELIEEFEYFGLPLTPELSIFRLEGKKEVSWIERRVLKLNGTKNDILNRYIDKIHIKNEIFGKDIHEGIEYDDSTDEYYVDKQADYGDFIQSFIEKNDCNLSVKQKKVFNIDKLHDECNLLHLRMNWSVFEPKTLFRISSLLSYQQSIQLSQWLGLNKKWKLLYKASRDGFTSSDFHRCCDNKGGSLTIIQSINDDGHMYLFGGFTTVTWNADSVIGGWGEDDDAFIYTLTNPHKVPATRYPIRNHLFAIYSDIEYGPTFGTNIKLGDEMNKPVNYINNGDSYEMDPQYNCALYVGTDNKDVENYFSVNELEVLGFEEI